MFGKCKSPIKGKKGAEEQFYREHLEEFKFFVKYFPVFKDIAIKVGIREIENLNAEKPCVFRKDCEIPFRCRCDICANNGESVKTLKDCRECKASKKDD